MNADTSRSELADELIKRAEDEIDAQSFREGPDEFENGKTISLDELRAELGIKRD